MKMNDVLVVAAHPDDEILGLGGTIHELTTKGISCNVIILGEGLTSREKSRADTSEITLNGLKNNTLMASRIVGYSDVKFCGLPDNRLDSMALLDIIKIIESFIDQYHPDTVFTHHYGDLNVDHRIAFEAVMTACRPVNKYSVRNVICFETPSSTEWNFNYSVSSFKPNLFFDISATLQHKLEAMKCYVSETAEYPHPRSGEALEAIAKRWGTVVGKRYAEAFEIIRSVEDGNTI